uniref:Uncharacterized protein n=1 Tax=Opuntia streptacantha TaxID=393608 RepID=A0A7C8Z4Y8_OPUST
MEARRWGGIFELRFVEQRSDTVRTEKEMKMVMTMETGEGSTRDREQRREAESDGERRWRSSEATKRIRSSRRGRWRGPSREKARVSFNFCVSHFLEQQAAVTEGEKAWTAEGWTAEC